MDNLYAAERMLDLTIQTKTWAQLCILVTSYLEQFVAKTDLVD